MQIMIVPVSAADSPYLAQSADAPWCPYGVDIMSKQGVIHLRYDIFGRRNEWLYRECGMQVCGIVVILFGRLSVTPDAKWLAARLAEDKEQRLAITM